LHLIAIARAAGIIIDWTDFNHISEAVPSIVRVYPNGTADINHFQACGGMGYLVKTLLNGGFLHADVKTIMGSGMEAYTKEPYLEKGALRWRSSPKDSLDQDVLRSVENPFSPTGGLKILKGNLGRSVIKISAVKAEHHVINAPAQVFTNQSEVVEAFKRKELNRDVIVVVKNQGPQANGMPELHKLTPCLSILQNQGFKVALVTDGRMSGASGKVPAAIHLSPESLNGGPIHKVRSGDMLELNAAKGTLNCLESDFEMREASSEVSAGSFGVGRELFNQLRPALSLSEEGASFVI
jgi:phosphogluconate dehydratase